MIMKIQGDRVHDFFTDPVYEHLLGYLKDSAVPSSSPAAAGQQKPKSTKRNQVQCSTTFQQLQLRMSLYTNSAGDPQEQQPSGPVGNYAGTHRVGSADLRQASKTKKYSTAQREASMLTRFKLVSEKFLNASPFT